jgi:hypothetical protein
MFHMMNEARIGVGLGAVMLGYAGYEASAGLRAQRPQGRPMAAAGKDAASRRAHHRARRRARMLLAQKSYVEGAGAGAVLRAPGRRAAHRQRRGAAQAAAGGADPIAKSWPSEWCLEANSLAIQVLGGYGYTRDFPVEQYWRDNRLNMIHEGTHGIQALDLLGRKVVHGGRRGLRRWPRVQQTIERAIHADWAPQANRPPRRGRVGRHQGLGTGEPEEALANAVPYLQAFGHTVLAWLWLDVALAGGRRGRLRRGKRAAARYFFAYELPKISAWLEVVARREPLCRGAGRLVLNHRRQHEHQSPSPVRPHRPGGAGHRRLARPGPADGRGAGRSRRQDHADLAQGGRPGGGRGRAAAARHRRPLDRRRCAAKPEEAHRVVAETMERLGQIDILVNNAGATWGAPAEDHPLEAWDKVMNLNIRSLFVFARPWPRPA